MRNLCKKVRPRMKFSDLTLMRGGASPFAGIFVRLVEHVEIILERAHPRCHFFLLGARQETNIFAHGNSDARHDDFTVDFLV